MKLEILKCPNCGGKLETENKERATCIHCGYDFIIDDENVEIHNHYYNNTHNNYNTARPQVVKPNNTQTASSKAVIFVLAAILGLFVLAIIAANSNVDSNNIIEESFRIMPESEPMVNFVEYVYNKPAHSITSSEFAELKYLDIAQPTAGAYKEMIMSYSFERYDESEAFKSSIKEFYLTTEKDLEVADLQCFTGLMHLGFNGSSNISSQDYYNGTSFAILEDLVSYSGSFNESLTEISNNFYDKSKIISLSIQLRRQEDIDEVLTFPNIKSLDITYIGDEATDLKVLSGLEKLEKLTLDPRADISWISSLTNLKAFVMKYGYNVNDYKVLYGMPGLNTLELYAADELKEIGFVKNMPALNRLVLEGSSVMSLEPLRGKTSIVELSLLGNRDINDTEALGTLTSLKTLDITTKIPNLAALEQLSSVNIEGKYLEQITHNSGIKNLSINLEYPNPDQFDCAVLLRYPNLEALAIAGGDATNTQALKELNFFKSLSLYNTDFRNKGEDIAIFQHPTLENLTIEDSAIDIDLSAVVENNALKFLKIEDCNFGDEYRAGVNVGEGEKGGLAGFTGLFSNLKGLESLSLQSAKLDNLDFVKSLKALKHLDITDNFISDVSPLVLLEKFEYLECDKNPITNMDILGDKVHVISNN